MVDEDKQDELTEDEKDMIREMPLSVQNIEYVTDKIKRDVDIVKTVIGNLERELRQNQYRGTRRLGLYYMVGVGALAAFFTLDKATEIDKKVGELRAPQVRTANVLGAEAPEKFYDIDGQRVYLEIDGKPVEQYVRGGN